MRDISTCFHVGPLPLDVHIQVNSFRYYLNMTGFLKCRPEFPKYHLVDAPAPAAAQTEYLPSQTSSSCCITNLSKTILVTSASSIAKTSLFHNRHSIANKLVLLRVLNVF